MLRSSIISLKSSANEKRPKRPRAKSSRKQKTVGNGGSKVKAAESQPKPEDKVSPAARAQSTMNLFDSANESGAEADTTRAVGNASVPGAANSQDASSNNNPGPVEVSN